jgi:hypothetical protein
MSQSQLLIRCILALKKTNNPYMLTGSFASSIQGEPRATHDIDMLIEAQWLKIERFLAEFPVDEYYYDLEDQFISMQRFRDAS